MFNTEIESKLVHFIFSYAINVKIYEHIIMYIILYLCTTNKLYTNYTILKFRKIP